MNLPHPPTQLTVVYPELPTTIKAVEAHGWRVAVVTVNHCSGNYVIRIHWPPAVQTEFPWENPNQDKTNQ